MPAMATCEPGPGQETCVMLTEIEKDREVGQAGYRRHFSGESLDLIVHYDIEGRLDAFILTAMNGQGRMTLSWKEGLGYTLSLPAEERAVAKNQTREPLVTRFLKESAGIDRGLAALIAQKIREYHVPL